jgi:hypothetical protein
MRSSSIDLKVYTPFRLANERNKERRGKLNPYAFHWQHDKSVVPSLSLPPTLNHTRFAAVSKNPFYRGKPW